MDLKFRFPPGIQLPLLARPVPVEPILQGLFSAVSPDQEEARVELIGFVDEAVKVITSFNAAAGTGGSPLAAGGLGRSAYIRQAGSKTPIRIMSPPMASLYDTLLPHIQDINAEGGNFSSFHLSKPVLDTIDAGVPADPSLAMIQAKILEKVAAYRGKRDHKGFNQIFEAYTEGVIYLVARDRRRLNLNALSDGAKYGKTSDFCTTTEPAIGLEVKTINVVDPERTIDAAMDRGFEAGYEALEEARAEAAAAGQSGIGFATTEFAPHGPEADPKDAVRQVVQKIKGNLKSGQYAARPTLLVVSLVRLGVHQGWADLRQRLDIDEDCGVAPSGHLYAIAAHRLEESYFDRSHKWFGVRDAGELAEQGVLRDHDYIAGIVFLQTIWHRGGDPDAIETGFRFYGVWNDEWTAKGFTSAQKAEARRVFDQLCDGWNDTHNSQGTLIPDVRALHDTYTHVVGKFCQSWRNRTPDAPTLGAFLAEADRAFYLWKAAEAGRLNAAADYVAHEPDAFTTGRISGDGRPTMFVTASRAVEDIPRLRLVKTGHKWEADDEAWPVIGGAILI
ncbi:MAG: hypothetical protein V4759_18555 [Pseudomonadota bacterium]